MQRYFDAHLFIANWGEAAFMLRLPMESADSKILSRFSQKPYLEIEKLTKHWLLSWSLGETDDYDRFADIEEINWMVRLAPLRDELMRGDLRSLYIGWLRGVTTGEVHDDEQEPLLPNGLGELTTAQQALANFIEVDPDLLAGAGIGSPPLEPDPPRAKLDGWLDELPKSEVRKYLHQMLAGEGALAEQALKRRYAEWLSTSTPQTQWAPRKVAELRRLAEQAKSVRLKKDAQSRKRAEARSRKQRETFLTNLAKDFPRAWKLVNVDANKGHASAYDAACRQLADLRDAYKLQDRLNVFHKELQHFMTRHRQRRALVERLVKAGIN